MFLADKKVLFIGLVWPEPTSSAAGTRILQLIELFLEAEADVYFASAASKSNYSHPLTNLGVTEISIELNNPSFENELEKLSPTVVVYDRFMIEEQYGWKVRKVCPNAYTILDTEDLHFLRQARQIAVKKNAEIELQSDLAKREIASIFRSDLSLIISQEEIKLLKEKFSIPDYLLYYLPFLEDHIEIDNFSEFPNFSEREHFIFIGNFIHEPNWHTTLRLKNEIWPTLKKLTPTAEMHIYGAYMSDKVQQLHNPAERFLIMGRAENARKIISKYKILLAPIQFGAGVKGKLVDAMAVGTPSITTSIGAEGMQNDKEWNGSITDSMETFCILAQSFYTEEKKWKKAQLNGIELINTQYNKDLGIYFINFLETALPLLEKHRQRNFIGQLLHHHTMNSLKYMSLWIEEKNKPKL